MELHELLDSIYRYMAAERHFRYVAAQSAGHPHAAGRSELAEAVGRHVARLLRHEELRLRIAAAQGTRRAALAVELADVVEADSDAAAASARAEAVHFLMRGLGRAAALPEPTVHVCGLLNAWVRAVREDEGLRRSTNQHLVDAAGEYYPGMVAGIRTSLLLQVGLQADATQAEHLAVVEPGNAEEHLAVARERRDARERLQAALTSPVVESRARMDELWGADAAAAVRIPRRGPLREPTQARDVSKRQARNVFGTLATQQHAGRHTSLWLTKHLSSGQPTAEVEELVLRTTAQVMASRDLARRAEDPSNALIAGELRQRAAVLDLHVGSRIHDLVVPWAVSHALEHICDVSPMLPEHVTYRLMKRVAEIASEIPHPRRDPSRPPQFSRMQITDLAFEAMHPYRQYPVAAHDASSVPTPFRRYPFAPADVQSVHDVIADARRTLGDLLYTEAERRQEVGPLLHAVPGVQVGMTAVEDAMKVVGSAYAEWFRRAPRHSAGAARQGKSSAAVASGPRRGAGHQNGRPRARLEPPAFAQACALRI